MNHQVGLVDEAPQGVGAPRLISDRTAAFLAGVMPVVVGVRRRGGAVKLNPAWYEYRDDRFWLNSWRGAHWLAHVEREQAAALLFLDPADMYRLVHIDARLIDTASEGAVEHLDSLSYRYRGKPYRSRSRVPQQRVIVRLAPERVRSSLDWLA